MTKICAVVVIAILSLQVFSLADPVVDVQKIAGKSETEVSKVLGLPSSQSKTQQGPKKVYKSGKVEVVFIGGKADWITVSELSDLPFDAKAIEALGLKAAAPTFQNNFVIKWEPHGSYRSVSIFNLNGKVDYAYIKAATK